MSTKNVSMKAIASQLNVSINTVSHALRDMDDISEELKSKIRKKALELGYMPNRVAQRMRKDEKPVVAILINSFLNLYFNTFSCELTKLLHEKNKYGFLLLYSERLDNDVIKQCVLQRVDLLVTQLEPPPDTLDFANLNDIKIVLVGNKPTIKNMDTVSVDHQAGCSLAARYLTEKGKKLVYVGIDYFLSEYRYSIFLSEVRKMCENAEVRYFDTENEDICTLYSLVEQGYRGLFFYNDMLVYEVIAKLEEIGGDLRKKYADLRTVGFDGLCRNVYGLEKMVTVMINFQEFALGTYRVIENRLKKPGSGPQQLIQPVMLYTGEEEHGVFVARD